jgi:caffeoyl-CoA O-methyltransferase
MISTTNTMTPPRPITPIGIAAHHLEAAMAILSGMDNVPADLAAQMQSALLLVGGLDEYLERSTTPASSELTEIAVQTQREPWSEKFDRGETTEELEQEMLTGQVEGQTLKMFVQMTRATRILDIGMFTGYSALAMAEALPDDGCLVACEIDPYAVKFARKLFDRSPHGYKIGIEEGGALATLDRLAASGATFDFAFLDAAKGEYVDYYHKLLDGLLAPDGYICADNTLFLGQVYLPEAERGDTARALAHFSQFVADDPRTEQVLIPIRDGLTLIRRV